MVIQFNTTFILKVTVQTRKNTIETVMGEVEYVKAMYEVEEDGIKKRVYLLDEKLHINTEGKASENLVEKIVETVPITDSYRKAETVLKETTNIRGR